MDVYVYYSNFKKEFWPYPAKAITTIIYNDSVVRDTSLLTKDLSIGYTYVPNTVLDSVKIRMEIDYYNSVAETNETNNIAEKTVYRKKMAVVPIMKIDRKVVAFNRIYSLNGKILP